MRAKQSRPDRRPSTLHAHAAYLRAAGVVAAVTGVSVRQLTERRPRGRPRLRRGSPDSFAVHAAIYLTIVHFNVQAAALARALGCHRWNISRFVQLVELERDRAGPDILLERMEAML